MASVSRRLPPGMTTCNVSNNIPPRAKSLLTILLYGSAYSYNLKLQWQSLLQHTESFGAVNDRWIL